ncbi:MAG TPA: cyclic nucleotide-binding domain-containing protein [Alkalispirochaeta sp.]|nr:cyclic nucleotide-binding domain-containing protein [Alkalispirochaeta sp.]
MRRFPVVSSDTALNDRVQRICDKFGDTFHPVFLDSVEDALEYIRYELPEFQLVHFSDEGINGEELIRSITEDPWLHYGGVIGVYSRKDSIVVENLPRETNVVTMIRRGEFVETFFRVLYILYRNRQILFQRDMQLDFLGTIHGSLEMDNDPYNARTYASLISNFLFNSNYVDIEMRDRLHVALFEMIMNAIEHGNCGISYEEKTQYLTDYGDIIPLIRDRCRDPEIGSRRVRVTYRIRPTHSSFHIRDDGDGFDWRSRLDDTDLNFGEHGHGIRMTRHYIDNLEYNDRGNEVRFDVPHEKQANATPGIFADQEVVEFDDGDVVFEEGEESNDLFYIVTGTLEIVSGGQKIATLTPDDIFIGEMSFLLGNRRSATVVAREHARLVKVTKNAFVNGIQRQPHYGIFLARLLAQRLSRLNQQVAAQSG